MDGLQVVLPAPAPPPELQMPGMRPVWSGRRWHPNRRLSTKWVPPSTFRMDGDPYREADAVIELLMMVAEPYAQARKAWNENRASLGHVSEYPDDPRYGPNKSQAAVDMWLQHSNYLRKEDSVRPPPLVPVVEVVDLPAPSPPSSPVWRRFSAAVPTSPQKLLKKLSIPRALTFPLLAKLSPRSRRKRRESQPMKPIENNRELFTIFEDPSVAELRPLPVRSVSAPEALIEPQFPKCDEKPDCEAEADKKRRRATLDDGAMASATDRKVDMVVSETKTVSLLTPSPPLSSLPPRRWPRAYPAAFVPPAPRRLTLSEIDLLPIPPAEPVQPDEPLAPLSGDDYLFVFSGFACIIMVCVGIPSMFLYAVYFAGMRWILPLIW